jgi:hypothetical protein
MGPGEHRPYDEQYWIRPWSTTLFAGDLFAAVPFGDQPIALYTVEDGPEAGKHFVGEIAIGCGLLVTPTCDMVAQDSGDVAHPYRALVPVVPLARVAEQVAAVDKSVELLRSRDAMHPYMYLPALPGALREESVACLFRPSLVSEELLADRPRRVAQLRQHARRHLKVKLARYWGRVDVDPDELPLAERGEEDWRAEGWPPSRYDDPAAPAVEL